MRIQPRIKNRKDIHSGVTKEINRKIENLALRFDCSKSFVTNTLLADALGIELEYRYDRREATRKAKGTEDSARILYHYGRSNAKRGA